MTAPGTCRRWDATRLPEFLEAHIPGAAFFDIDGICDPDSSLPHMLPSPELFAGSVSALGVGDDSHVVVYDSVGLYSAARVWWMFRVFGHERVSVLAGGLPRWRAEGRPVESGEVRRSRQRSVQGCAEPRRHDGPLVRAGPRHAWNRRRGRSWMHAPPPASRARIRGPGPISRAAIFQAPATCPSPPSSTMTTQRWAIAAAIRRAFADAGVDPAQPVIATCGSGITACTLALALAAIGAEEVAVYDGSWSDWGSRADAPVESGGPA